MDKFLSVFRAYSPERPLRPLLLATGAAAAAAGIYYLVKWTDGNKTTANPEDTSDPGDPVCNGATEPALVRLTEVVQDQMKCEKEQEAHNILQLYYQEMMETLTNSEIVLKALLGEVEEKHQKALGTMTQLEQEKSNLTYQVKTLQNTMQDMGNQLFYTHLQCEELKIECEQEQEAHRLLNFEYQEMMETLTNNETVLKDSLAEAEKKHQKAEKKRQKAVKTITQLRREKFNLRDQMKTLRNTMQYMGNQLFYTHLQCDELKKKCERVQKANRLLKSKYQVMMETLTDSETLLKESLAEAEKKNQKAVETINQLKQAKSNLTDQVKSLRETVKGGGNQLCDTQLQCDELKKECEQEQESHRLTTSEYQEMMETLTKSEKFLKIPGKSPGSEEIDSNVTQSGSSSESAL
ncbi:leucine-rich repeat flightless-interacting protein 2-like [Tachysurus fulvidraco]|uniref:leucine-rich repeat flightless-interacting protein 2-like n=1 Tax=Tachysurus fulvidraco TaxID=1234273 RepID=UPI001FEE8A8A|nr:leucine-rich repeat flightless-interacting protein 2-like [Tachysurus fulvidraco]XP_047666421.1 leucine-rich repeat flightless-interacting protein 2-like [Tachysurus fulvidraco]